MGIQFSDEFPRSVYYLVVRNPYAPESLFGTYNTRKNYSPDEAQQVFQQAWDAGLGIAIENTQPADYATVKDQITEQEQRFLRQDLEHRMVRYRDLTFVAQLVPKDEQTYEIDQLWFVHSHDKDSIILCVEFETPEERERFHQIAKRLGHRNGRELLQDYVNDLLQEEDRNQ